LVWTSLLIRPVFFFFHGQTAANRPGNPHYWGFTITLRHTTVGRTPLHEWSVRRRELYLTTQKKTHKNRQPCPRQDLLYFNTLFYKVTLQATNWEVFHILPLPYTTYTLTCELHATGEFGGEVSNPQPQHSERPQTYASGRAATAIGCVSITEMKLFPSLILFFHYSFKSLKKGGFKGLRLHCSLTCGAKLTPVPLRCNVPAPDGTWVQWVGRMVIGMDKPKCWETQSSQYHFVQNKFHMDEREIKSGPLPSDRLASNILSYYI